jgi:hypothetical protein
MRAESIVFHKKLGLQRMVEADRGGVLGGRFSVRLRGSFKLVYQEGDYSIKVGTEPLRAGGGRLVYLLAIRQWESPHQGECLSEEQIRQIRSNILSALNFMGIKFESNWCPTSI